MYRCIVNVIIGCLVSSCMKIHGADVSSEKGNYNNERLLYHTLFDDYHIHTRPIKESQNNITIKLEFELKTIGNIDEKNQIFHTVGFLVAKWTDDYLIWDPADYGGLTNLVVPPNVVWLPDIGIINSADTFYHESFREDFRVDIESNGTVIWAFGGNFATTCELDMTYYPFDRQTCNISVENWAYSGHAVDLSAEKDHVMLDDYSKNGLWELEFSTVHKHNIYHDIYPGVPFPKVTFNMYIRRKGTYYLLNILLPCFFMIVLSLTVFWLPADAGEKVSLGITVLLAFSVFMFTIAENTPKNSDFTPILSVFVAGIMFLSTISVASSIFVLYLHHKISDQPPPNILRKIFFQYIARLVCVHHSVPASYTDSKPNKGQFSNHITTPKEVKVDTISMEDMNSLITTAEKLQEENKNDWVPANQVSLQRISRHLRYIVDYYRGQEHRNTVAEEWKALARVVDRLLFWICFIIIAIFSTALLVQRDEHH